MLKNTIAFHFKLSFVFLLLALFFSLLYSIQLLGYGSDMFPPANTRSLHISLMLYGFAPLMLSLLPFTLFDKDHLVDKKGIHYLNLYFIFWYIFLIFMLSSLILGMSFAFIVLYYLIIKLHSNINFKPRFSLLWITPLLFYILSVLYRMTIGELTYNQEWFLQWLTLLYIPTLYFWFKDAKLTIKDNVFLFISLVAFVVVDIEGNILFIPEIRHLFHRNDLVVGHAHIAVGISMLFLSFTVVKNYFTITNKMIVLWALMLTFMALVLSLSGLYQANFITIPTHIMWIARTLFGAILFLFVLRFYLLQFPLKKYSTLEYYHIIGFLSDGLGGVLLLFFAQPLYHLLGFQFSVGYQTVVFGFMLSIGIMHFMGFFNKTWQIPMAVATAFTRVVVSSLFFALYLSHHLDLVALGVSGYDLFYALIYVVFLHAV
jgi:hypothetical protein